MLQRALENTLKTSLSNTSKVVVLLGPRQVGKTTLMQKIMGAVTGTKEVLNGDYINDQQLLKPERASLKSLVSHLNYLFIDEAQNVENIGLVLKLIHDEFSAVRVMATGSSSFDLKNKMGEPLTGRQQQFVLYPISYAEQNPKLTTQDSILQQSLIYGSYPEAITLPAPEQKISYLKQLVADYLLKDLYRQVEVNQHKLADMLKLLAFQIGSEVSLNEIANAVQMDVKTVSQYLSYLERAFVVIRLGAFSRNLRKEVSKAQKIYFFDLGIRNALIQAFNPLDLRDDVGKLWENFLIIERIKFCAYQGIHANHYFWRTYDKQKIDLIEEQGGQLSAFEFKYSATKKSIPSLWSETYRDSKKMIVTKDNLAQFLLP